MTPSRRAARILARAWPTSCCAPRRGARTGGRPARRRRRPRADRAAPRGRQGARRDTPRARPARGALPARRVRQRPAVVPGRRAGRRRGGRGRRRARPRARARGGGVGGEGGRSPAGRLARRGEGALRLLPLPTRRRRGCGAGVPDPRRRRRGVGGPRPAVGPDGARGASAGRRRQGHRGAGARRAGRRHAGALRRGRHDRPRRLRGLRGLELGVRVAVDSGEAPPGLVEAADVVVAGPEGVLALLRSL